MSDEHGMLSKGIPREGLSVILSFDGMYRDDSQMEFVRRSVVICCNTWLCSGLCDFPSSMALITPMLSDFIVKCILVKPWCTASLSPQLIAMISAQPILWCWLESQLSASFQESHSLLKTTPIPQDVDASTQNSIMDG